MFIVVDGPNGVGKTTLIKSLEEKGYLTLSSPNGTPLAKMIRPACRGTEPWTDIDKRVQFLLFSAARLDEYIRMVHGRDKAVVSDRWWTSTFVYQCKLQGLPVSFLEHTLHPEEKIDLVILLDGDDKILIERVEKDRQMDPFHGKCRWTQDAQTQKSLMSLYRTELPNYLDSKEIKHHTIDTSKLSMEEVVEEAERLIKTLK